MLVCASFCAHCTRDRGCSAHPAFPAPSLFERGKLTCKPRADRAARTPMHIYSLKNESPVSAPQGEGSGRCSVHTHIPGTDAPPCRYPAPPAPSISPYFQGEVFTQDRHFPLK